MKLDELAMEDIVTKHFKDPTVFIRNNVAQVLIILLVECQMPLTPSDDGVRARHTRTRKIYDR